MTKFVAIGECMIEMRPSGQGADTYIRGYAGDTFNTAWYLARHSDINVSYLTVLGRDRFGRAMREDLQRDGIDTSLVMTSPDKNTGLYFADVNERGNRDYTFFRHDSAARQLFQHTDSKEIIERTLTYDVMYASAISLMILDDAGRRQLADLFARARKNGVTTAFDTNYRPSGWDNNEEAAQWIREILTHTDMAFPTFDENSAVFGDDTPADTLKRTQTYGCAEVVVKDGGNKCLIHADGETVTVEALKDVPVKDTTAAGDSFNAAYLAARLKGLSPADSARAGHRRAAKVIQHTGALVPDI